MTLDPTYVELNRAATSRLRALTARLNDAELQHPLGEHWTVAIALAHVAFWDGRILYVLDKTEHDGQLCVLNIDLAVNDLSLPFWAAIPPREAARLAIEAAEALDQRLEGFPPALLDAAYSHDKRLVFRALHRNDHLDGVEAALKS